MGREQSNEDEKSLFLNEKPVMALVTIRRNRGELYVSQIAKNVDTTYAHTVKIINKLEETGHVKSRKKGRKKFCQLTDKGKDRAERFGTLVDTIEQEATSPILA